MKPQGAHPTANSQVNTSDFFRGTATGSFTRRDFGWGLTSARALLWTTDSAGESITGGSISIVRAVSVVATAEGDATAGGGGGGGDGATPASLTKVALAASDFDSDASFGGNPIGWAGVVTANPAPIAATTLFFWDATATANLGDVAHVGDRSKYVLPDGSFGSQPLHLSFFNENYPGTSGTQWFGDRAAASFNYEWGDADTDTEAEVIAIIATLAASAPGSSEANGFAGIADPTFLNLYYDADDMELYRITGYTAATTGDSGNAGYIAPKDEYDADDLGKRVWENGVDKVIELVTQEGHSRVVVFQNLANAASALDADGNNVTTGVAGDFLGIFANLSAVPTLSVVDGSWAGFVGSGDFEIQEPHGVLLVGALEQLQPVPRFRDAPVVHDYARGRNDAGPCAVHRPRHGHRVGLAHRELVRPCGALHDRRRRGVLRAERALDSDGHRVHAARRR